jgi:hypothetical protein
VRLRIDAPEITHAYRLRKADGTHHDVHADGSGAHCSCGDHTYRHEGIDAIGCKHIRSLRAWALLPAAPAYPTASADDASGTF